MKDKIIYEAFSKENIFCVKAAELSKLKIIKEYLIPKGVCTALVWLLPYNVGTPEGNISLYARTLDYHRLFDDVSKRIAKNLKKQFPDANFYNFSDHSPIAEVSAAASLGLGVIGENNLLINEKYGSYIFVGTLFTDLVTEYDEIMPIKSCIRCGACKRACPTKSLENKSMDACLSFINQKKGTLTNEEEKLIKESKMAWGCDVCQLSCPMNKNAEKTPVSLFYENRIEFVTKELILSMTQDEFKSRAFSFRGKEPILRNLDLLENS